MKREYVYISLRLEITALTNHKEIEKNLQQQLSQLSEKSSMLKKHRKCLIDDPLWSVKNWLKEEK